MSHTSQLKEFAVLIRQDREYVLERWRAQVRDLPSAKHLDVPTLNDHVPSLLDEVSAALIAGSDETIPEALVQDSPPAHGLQRLRDGFDIEEVVAEYNILRAAIHDLAERHGINIQGKAFRILNRVLDGAIGLAVQTYAEERAKEVRQRREEHLAFIVHDLRTPLSAVSLAAMMIEHHSTDSSSDMLRQLREIMGRNLAQIESLIAKIIDESALAESDSGQRIELRNFDLWPVVERLGEDLEPKFRESDVTFLNSVPHSLSVRADSQLVRRIFQNLVVNAIKYTPGGLVEVGAMDDFETASVECWVSDNGTGIPQELIGKIFDKMETDPERDDGTGLGLSIVKSFVELHGAGSVVVESELGVGTTFRFRLPAKP